MLLANIAKALLCLTLVHPEATNRPAPQHSKLVGPSYLQRGLLLLAACLGLREPFGAHAPVAYPTTLHHSHTHTHTRTPSLSLSLSLCLSLALSHSLARSLAHSLTLSLSLSLCLSLSLSLSLCLSLSLSLSIYIYTQMHACIYIYIYIHIHTHTHTHIFSFLGRRVVSVRSRRPPWTSQPVHRNRRALLRRLSQGQRRPEISFGVL